MSEARDAVISDIHRLMASGQVLRDQLLESRRGFEKGLELLHDDMPLTQALDELNTAERRVKMTDLLAEFDECRHRLRISITAAGLEEGMSIGDIGRAFGVSRQLAARFAKEVRAQVGPPEPPAPTAR
jgi:hypothetical protein